ncbi:DUF937 domain-containing protein [Streptomyces venezuelae]|uniref:DUF937 domain-containing protein n=1 Tax=Streptomyces venezuelae TaxID=54571 RepID=A0A5P2C6G7_STRVZ|nr:DUF937 domain-containing protein [Streptomyces venezuelae]QES36299.1 hypothetical protein DEJ48_25435 [Streptomyces venezuelae]
MTDDSQTSEPRSFEQDVLDELGDDRLQEIAGLLDTDASGAQDVVGTTVSALSGDIQGRAADPAEADEVRQAFDEVGPADPTLQGVATLGGLGGLAGGGMMAGMLAKMSRPVANAVSKKTGIPAAKVTRVIEMLIPVVLAVLSKRAARTKGPGGAPSGSAPSSGGGLGDLLGQILGGKK